MSARVEWMSASMVEANVFAPGEEWVGADAQDAGWYVLTLALDEVTAVEGTLADLRAVASRVQVAVDRAAAKAVSAAPSPDVTLRAVSGFARMCDRIDDGVFEHFTCDEVEGLADVLRAAGEHEAAARMIASHAETDHPGDQHYQGDRDGHALPA